MDGVNDDMQPLTLLTDRNVLDLEVQALMGQHRGEDRVLSWLFVGHLATVTLVEELVVLPMLSPTS